MTHKWMIRGLPVTVVAVGALVAAAIGGASRGTANAVPAPTQLSMLRALAHAAASAQGEKSPSNDTVVATSRRAINRLAGGAVVNSDQPVFVVTMHGRFIDYNASVPTGAALPRGDTLTLVYDATSLRLTDLILATGGPDVRQLGSPRPLDD